MNHPDVMRIEMSSDASELSPTRETVREWLTERGWGDHGSADVVLALDEALTNVIRHGYKNEPGRPIVIDVKPLAANEHGPGVHLTIRDWAFQVPLDKICGRDLDDLRPGGLGVHLIRSLMDDACYEHAEGGGMRLTMHRHEMRPEDNA